MNEYDSAKQQSLNNLNKIYVANKIPLSKPPAPLKTAQLDTAKGISNIPGINPGFAEYINKGVDLSKSKGTAGGLWTAPDFVKNFAIDVTQGILNIPSNVIGGGLDIAAGNNYKGAGRVGQGLFDFITTFTPGTKLLKGAGLAEKAVGQVAEKTAPTLLKSVGKGAAIGAGYGSAQGFFGGLQQAQDVVPEQRLGTIATSTGYGALGGAVIGAPLGAIGYKFTPKLNEIDSTANKVKLFSTGEIASEAKAKYDTKGNLLVDYRSPNEYANIALRDIKNVKFVESKAATGENILTPEVKINKWDMAFNPTKAIQLEPKGMLQDWVNLREGGKIATQLAIQKPFQELTKLGFDGIKAFQAGESSKLFAQATKYFDERYTIAKSVNPELNFRENYVPQLWANPLTDVEKVFSEKSNRLSLNPEFTLQRVIKDYEEGIAKGLTPRYNNIADLITWYEGALNKQIADKRFFGEMLQKGFIAPAGNAPTDWTFLSDNFPKFSIKVKGGSVQNKYKATPELANLINNYFETNRSPIIGTIADYFSSVKSRLFAAGIPFTGLNFHGLNILVRNTLFSDNPVKGFAQSLYFLVKPSAATKYLEENLGKLEFAAASGLNVTSRDMLDLKPNEIKQMLSKGQTILSKFKDVEEKYISAFEDPLFKKIIPAIKTDKFYQVYDELKPLMGEKAAAKRSAEIVNGVFGGINTNQLFRSKEVSNVMRLVLLAPDWFTTNFYEIPTGIAKSFVDKSYKPYQKFAKNFLASYITANITNKMLSGHYMWENEPNQRFNLDTGTKDANGNTRYIAIYGTAADFARIPFEVIKSFSDGDFSTLPQTLRNRFSPAGQAAFSLIANVDYAGRPIFGTDKYGNPLTGAQQAINFSKLVPGLIGTPNWGQEGLTLLTDSLQGKNPNWEQALIKTFEVPLKYKAETSKITEAQKARTDLRNQLEQAIVNNDMQAAGKLANQFTQSDANNIVSSAEEKLIKSKLTTQEKLIYSLSNSEKAQLVKENPSIAVTVDKVKAIADDVKATSQYDSFKALPYQPNPSKAKTTGVKKFKSKGVKFAGKKIKSKSKGIKKLKAVKLKTFNK